MGKKVIQFMLFDAISVALQAYLCNQ